MTVDATKLPVRAKRGAGRPPGPHKPKSLVVRAGYEPEPGLKGAVKIINSTEDAIRIMSRELADVINGNQRPGSAAEAERLINGINSQVEVLLRVAKQKTADAAGLADAPVSFRQNRIALDSVHAELDRAGVPRSVGNGTPTERVNYLVTRYKREIWEKDIELQRTREKNK